MMKPRAFSSYHLGCPLPVVAPPFLGRWSASPPRRPQDPKKPHARPCRARPPRRPKGSGTDGRGRRRGAARGGAAVGSRVLRDRRRRVGGRVGQPQARGAAQVNAQCLVRGVRGVHSGGPRVPGPVDLDPESAVGQRRVVRGAVHGVPLAVGLRPMEGARCPQRGVLGRVLGPA